MEEEGHSWKLSDQSEVLLHKCSLAISNSESFMGTHSTIINALSFAVFLVYCILSHPCFCKLLYVSRFEKGVTSCIFQNFNFKCEWLCYVLETCYDYPTILLLYPLRIPSPSHFLCGCRSVKTTHGQKSAVYTSVWWPPLLTWGYLQLQTWDLWSRISDVPIN